MLRNLLSLCDNKNKFVYEVASNIFKADLSGCQLSIEELEFWTAFNLIKTAETYGVKVDKLTFDETIEAINKREREIANPK